MKKHNDFKVAIGVMKNARFNAIQRKRENGDPHNPFCARSGCEAEFYQADQHVRIYNFILKLLEKEAKRETREKTRSAWKKLSRFCVWILDIFIGTGLIILATLGFVSAFILFQFPMPIIQTAAVIGCAAALAWAVSRK